MGKLSGYKMLKSCGHQWIMSFENGYGKESLVDVFFNRQSAYLWVQTVLLFSPTCSFIRMRQTSYRGFSRKTKRNQPDPLISRSAIQMMYGVRPIIRQSDNPIVRRSDSPTVRQSDKCFISLKINTITCVIWGQKTNRLLTKKRSRTSETRYHRWTNNWQGHTRTKENTYMNNTDSIKTWIQS